MLKTVATFLRARIEGLAFLALFPLWFACALPGLFTGESWKNRRGWHTALVRWKRHILHGLDDFREANWVSWKFESKRDIWFHFLFIEFYSALNLSRLGSRQAGIPHGGSVLVVILTHLGDALHILPMVNGLHAARPDLHIDLIVGPWCSFLAAKTDAIRDTLSYTPRYVSFNRGQRAGLRGLLSELSFLFHLRRKRYDVLISTSTTNLPELLLLQASAPKQWVGCSAPITDWYSEVPGYLSPYDSRAYEAERVCDLLKSIGIIVQDRRLVFPIPRDSLEWGRSLRHKWTHGSTASLIALAPGAGWPGKQWPLERFAALAGVLRDRFNAVVVLLGAPSERELTSVVAREAGGGVIDFGGQTSLDQLAAVIACADLYIGNDSGPMHIAAALGTPSISLFGPTIASKWATTGPHNCVLQKHYSCNGCWSWHQNAACLHDRACMRAILLDDVIACVETLLKPIAKIS